jgi:hypothetical protein
MKTECKICNKEVKDLKGLSVHLSKIHKMNKEVLKNIMSFGGEMEYYVETGIYSQSEGNCCVKNMGDFIGRIRRKP